MLLEYTCVFMGIYLGVELLGHEICLHLTLAYNTKQFSKWFCQFTLYQPFIIVPSASLFQQHLALSVFLSLDIPLGRYYHLFVTLYCISVMTTKVKHSCKCLQDMFISSFMECLFKSFAYFFYLVVCLLLKDLQFFIFFGYKHFLDYMCCIYLFPPSGLPIHYFVTCAKQFIILICSNFSTLFQIQ